MLFVRGFLLTEADGTSPMEWLEPSWTGPMSLVSGAAATTFGGAYGGALVVEGSTQAQAVQGHLTAGNTGSDSIQSRINVTFPSELGKCVHHAHKTADTGITNGTNDCSLNSSACDERQRHPSRLVGISRRFLGTARCHQIGRRAHALPWTGLRRPRSASQGALGASPRGAQLEESSPSTQPRGLDIGALDRQGQSLRHLPVFQWIQRRVGMGWQPSNP